jgi:hypothetical protein
MKPMPCPNPMGFSKWIMHDQPICDQILHQVGAPMVCSSKYKGVVKKFSRVIPCQNGGWKILQLSNHSEEAFNYLTTFNFQTKQLDSQIEGLVMILSLIHIF